MSFRKSNDDDGYFDICVGQLNLEDCETNPIDQSFVGKALKDGEKPFTLTITDNGIWGDGAGIECSPLDKNQKSPFWFKMNDKQLAVFHEAIGSILRLREIQRKAEGR